MHLGALRNPRARTCIIPRHKYVFTTWDYDVKLLKVGRLPNNNTRNRYTFMLACFSIDQIKLVVLIKSVCKYNNKEWMMTFLSKFEMIF